MLKCGENSDWELTAVQNLLRYLPSGTYFARFKVGGKLIRKSLETTVFSVAKQRLPEMIREYRVRQASVQSFANGKMNVGDAAEVYLAKIAVNASLKPRSKDYIEQIWGFIRRSWVGLVGEDVRKVTPNDCQTWFGKYQQHYAGSVVNNSIAVLRAIFQEAISVGARFDNPTANLKRVRIKPKHLTLPSRDEFSKFVEEIRTAGARQSKDCAHLVRFLAFSGMRISEAKHVTWADVNFQKKELLIRGDPETGTKNSEIRRIPMIRELGKLLEEIRADRGGEEPGKTVMQVFECQKSMTNAAVRIGMKRITHHDLRHFFATICIESGVDVPTVSRWLGHKDGGALCMKTYGHLREEHSFKQAERVSFGISV